LTCVEGPYIGKGLLEGIERSRRQDAAGGEGDRDVPEQRNEVVFACRRVTAGMICTRVLTRAQALAYFEH
jgi:hypothetical protein